MNLHAPPPLLFCPSESAPLGQRIAAAAGIALAPLEERRFEHGEFKLRPLQAVRDRDVFVLQTLSADAAASIADRFVRLLFLLAGLRDAGARRRIALVPYLAYARKDRRTQVRDPVNTRYVAELMEATGLDRLVALDVHNPAALDNAFRIPTDHLSAQSRFVEQLASTPHEGALTVVSPDVGGVKRAQLLRERLQRRTGANVELVFVEKRRVGGSVSGHRLVGDVAGRTVVVLDDLSATGGTLVRAARTCRDAGARAVLVAVTHVPGGDVVEALLAERAIDQLIVTDSVGLAVHDRAASSGGRLVVTSIAPLFGAAVQRIHRSESMADLL